jgi:hypothetical protein
MESFPCALTEHHAMQAHLGSASTAPHIPRHYIELSGQFHAPAALYPGKERLVPSGWETGWAPEPVWTRWIHIHKTNIQADYFPLNDIFHFNFRVKKVICRHFSLSKLGIAWNFSLHHRVQNGSGAHPASYPIGTRGSFSGGKRPGLEADH